MAKKTVVQEIEMEYVGPGTKPANMIVSEAEVLALTKTGLWAKAVPDTGGGVTNG